MPSKKVIKPKDPELDLVNIKFSHDKERHEFRMKELQFARENEEIKHNNEMTRQRIKSAEIRKAQERRWTQ